MDRYGRQRRPGYRLVAVIATGALAVLGLLWVVWTGLSHANPPIRGTLVGYHVMSEQSVSVTFDVVKDQTHPATCVLRARDRDGVEVGRREVTILAGIRRDVRTEKLATSGRAVTGEIKECRIDR